MHLFLAMVYKVRQGILLRIEAVTCVHESYESIVHYILRILLPGQETARVSEYVF